MTNAEQLTPTESRLWGLLSGAMGAVVATEVLIQEGLGYPAVDRRRDGGALRQHVCHLRQKLGVEIQAITGRGYRVRGRAS